MPDITLKRTIQAPVADVWSSWNDCGNIVKLNPNLNRSFLIDNSGKTGLGATRSVTSRTAKTTSKSRLSNMCRRKRWP